MNIMEERETGKDLFIFLPLSPSFIHAYSYHPSHFAFSSQRSRSTFSPLSLILFELIGLPEQERVLPSRTPGANVLFRSGVPPPTPLRAFIATPNPSPFLPHFTSKTRSSWQSSPLLSFSLLLAASLESVDLPGRRMMYKKRRAETTSSVLIGRIESNVFRVIFLFYFLPVLFFLSSLVVALNMI